MRIAKSIAEIINNEKINKYGEPFCGMCSVGLLVNAKEKIFSDKDKSLVCMLNAACNGFSFPENVSEEDYKKGKNLLEDNPIHGFLKFGCSFAGKPWGGFARSGERNYAKNASNSLKKFVGLKLNVLHMDYADFPICDVLYCDPPYKNTTNVGIKERFDSDLFWNWIRARPEKVFISEYQAPSDFRCIFESKNTDGLSTTNIEKLFTK